MSTEVVEPKKSSQAPKLKTTQKRTLTKRAVMWLGQTCNLRCYFCYFLNRIADTDHPEHDFMTLDKAKEICHTLRYTYGNTAIDIQGGEPTIYPELPELIDGIIARRRHIYLCTNALKLQDNLYGKIAPHKRLTINIHLDGMRETHDNVCAREGVFDHAIEMLKEGKRLGHHVMTNTTVFKETDVDEVEELCKLTASLGVDGMLVSPGYHYESVQNEMFLTRREIHEKFKKVLGFSSRYKLSSTPMFLEFAAGMRDYRCSPWSTVTFTPKGWKGPCYLIGEKHTFDWNEFWTETDWDYWESRQDSRCQNCAMHSGFEASVVREARKSPLDMVRLAAWNMTG